MNFILALYVLWCRRLEAVPSVSPQLCANNLGCSSVGVPRDGRPWSVELDVRDLGGHLDITWRARAGTLSKRVKNATHGVVAVFALLLGFKVKLSLVRGTCLPAGLHAVEAPYVSAFFVLLS